MGKFFAFCFFAVLLIGCDDGEIIVTTFNFEDAELKNCGNLGNFVFYKVNPEARESISLKIGIADNLYKTAGTKTYPINGTTNFVNYRTYDGDLGTNYFCSSVPPTTPNVTVNYLSAAGNAEFTTTFLYDDNDGVPANIEFNGDTDGDGLPDLYDVDDDGDNVPTSLELDRENVDGDDNPFTNPLNTDSHSGNSVPDYLDADDDGDGVPTRNEDANIDLDPTNDVTDTSIGPDYLNPEVAETYIVIKNRPHAYKITKSVKIILKNVVLVRDEEEILIETLNMGEISPVETIEIVVYEE